MASNASLLEALLEKSTTAAFDSQVDNSTTPFAIVGVEGVNSTTPESSTLSPEEALKTLSQSIDDVYLLANAIFVCLMQSGFACLEAGAVRSKNVTNIIMKNLMDIFICCVAYWLVGYALTWGPDLGMGLAGGRLWLASGVTMGEGEWRWPHWFFQFTFAATAATIVSGAVAERCKYEAYLCYSALISGVVYPIAAHWAWGEEGWLRAAGYRDFAGAGPVHLLAGAISLVAAALLGPRAGRFPGGGAKGGGEPLPGHSTPLVGLGGMILIAGFLAFNGGSLGSVAAPGAGGAVARVMAVTVLGGAGGSLVALALGRVGLAGGGRRWPFAHALNASFAGMVSVCAAADSLAPWAALASGAGAGALYLALRSAVARCGVDDPLDVVAVHGGGGAWGLLAAALFSGDGTGVALDPSTDAMHALLWRVAGGAAICAWALFCALVLFGTLRLLGLLRVSADAELQGLDEAVHGEAGYPPEGWSNAGLSLSLGLGGPPASTRPLQRNAVFRSLADYSNAAYEDSERAPPR